MKCECKQYTIKVTEGNEWGLLLQLKTNTYESDRPIDVDIDFANLQNIVVKIDGADWEYSVEQGGILLMIPADMPLGPHNVTLTATYFGVDIRAAYYECFTIMHWSYESNVPNYIPEAPMSSEMAYIYVGLANDEQLDELKAEYRRKIAAATAAESAAREAEEEFDRKAAALDDVATKTQVGQLEQFWGITGATEFEAATAQEITEELNNIWNEIN